MRSLILVAMLCSSRVLADDVILENSTESVDREISKVLDGTENWSPDWRPRNRSRAILSGNSVCIAGGFLAGDQPTRDFGCFDTGAMRYSWRRPLPLAGTEFGLADLKGNIHMIGGMWKGKLSGYHLIFGPSSGGWAETAPLDMPRSAFGLSEFDGSLYLVGGRGADGGALDTVSIFSTSGGIFRWTSGPSLSQPRYDPLVVSVKGSALADGVYAIMGNNSDGSISTIVERLNPKDNIWQKRAPVLLPLKGAAVATIGGGIYVVGGSNHMGCESTVQIYTADSNSWGFGPPMPEPRCDAAAVGINGKLYVFGGRGPDSVLQRGKPRETILVLDPYRLKWFTLTRKAPPAVSRQNPSVIPTIKITERQHDFAVVVGIDQYRSVQAAKYAENDAAAAASFFQAFGVPKKNVIVLTGSSATLSGITKYVESWLPKNVVKDSRVYFYFSGHGAPDPESGVSYLIPWDADLPFLQQTGYPLERLYRELAALPAKDVTVFLDACFSGSGQRSVLLAGTRPLVNIMDTRAPSRLNVMAAAAAKETAGSFEEKQHGLFTYFLLSGLNGSRHVTFEELHEYVRGTVLREAHRQNREQNTQLSSPNPRATVY